jgi:hypothetical protein
MPEPHQFIDFYREINTKEGRAHLFNFKGHSVYQRSVPLILFQIVLKKLGYPRVANWYSSSLPIFSIRRDISRFFR